MTASAVYALVIVAAQVISSSPATTVEFTGSDVATRRQLMREVAASGYATSGEILSLLELGFQDTDSDVRFSAAIALSGLLAKAASGRAEAADPRLRLTLLPVLLHSLNDPDLRVRGVAVTALGYVARWPNQTVEKALVARYADEPAAGVRAIIVSELGAHAVSSPAVQRLVIEALQDEHPLTRQNAARTIARFSPPAALPRLADELSAGTEQTRPEVVYAIASYGAKARPYVPVLQQILSIETRQEVQQQIRQAIAVIQNDAR